MPPPSQQTLDRLTAADAGYERSRVLQALLNAAGDEDSALAILRGGTGGADGGQVAPIVVGIAAQPNTATVEATLEATLVGVAAEAVTVVDTRALEATLAEPAPASGSKTLTEKLSELNEAKESKLITEQEFQVGGDVPGMTCRRRSVGLRFFYEFSPATSNRPLTTYSFFPPRPPPLHRPPLVAIRPPRSIRRCVTTCWDLVAAPPRSRRPNTANGHQRGMRWSSSPRRGMPASPLAARRATTLTRGASTAITAS